MIHQLKIKEAFAEAILRGEKTFEVRVNDRGFQKGDHVVFNVIDKAGNSIEHPLIGKEYQISYVLSGWGIKNGYVCCLLGRGNDFRQTDWRMDVVRTELERGHPLERAAGATKGGTVMQIVIDIPSAFTDHFHNDRFYDALMRLSSDAHLLAGLYEQETAAMLIKAFEKAVEVPAHGRLVDADDFSAEMKKRQDAAMEWKKEAKDSETAARADAVLSFLSEVKLTLDKLPTVIPGGGSMTSDKL